MAIDEAVDDKDDKQENPCCQKWKQKFMKAEKGRKCLREAIGLLEKALQNSNEQQEALKIECEKAQKHADSESRRAKEEKQQRLEREKSHNLLKIELDTIQKKLQVVENEKNVLKKKELEQKKEENENTKELKRLKELMQEEKTALKSEQKKSEDLKKQANEEKKKAEEAKKRADTANKKIQEEKKLAHTANKKLAEELHCLNVEKGKSEQEKKRADEEKRRADEEKKHRELLEMKVKDIELEKTKLTERLKSIEVIKSTEVLKKDSTADSKKQIESLKEKLRKEREGAKAEKRKVEIWKSKLELLESENSSLKEQVQIGCKELQVQCNKVAEEKVLRDALQTDCSSLKEEVARLTEALTLLKTRKNVDCMQTNIQSEEMLLCKDNLLRRNVCCTNLAGESLDFISSESGEYNRGISCTLEPSSGGSVEKTMQNSGIDYTMKSFSDRQLIKSQGGDAFIGSGPTRWKDKEVQSCKNPENSSVFQREGKVDNPKTSEEVGKVYNSPESIVDSIAYLFSKEKKVFSVLEEKISVLKEALHFHSTGKRKRIIPRNDSSDSSSGDIPRAKTKKVSKLKSQKRKKQRISARSLHPSQNTKKIVREDEECIQDIYGGIQNLENCDTTDAAMISQVGLNVSKLLELDNESEEDRYVQASQCLLSPTLPNLPERIVPFDAAHTTETILKQHEIQEIESSRSDRPRKDKTFDLEAFDRLFQSDRDNGMEPAINNQEDIVTTVASGNLLEDISLFKTDSSNFALEQVMSEVSLSPTSSVTWMRLFGNGKATVDSTYCGNADYLHANKVCNMNGKNEQLQTQNQLTISEVSELLDLDTHDMGPQQSQCSAEKQSSKENAENHFNNMNSYGCYDLTNIDRQLLGISSSKQSDEYKTSSQSTAKQIEFPTCPSNPGVLENMDSTEMMDANCFPENKDISAVCTVSRNGGGLKESSFCYLNQSQNLDSNVNSTKQVAEKENQYNNEILLQSSEHFQSQEVREGKELHGEDKILDIRFYAVTFLYNESDFPTMLNKIIKFSSICFTSSSKHLDLESLLFSVTSDTELSAENRYAIIVSVMLSSLIPIELGRNASSQFSPAEDSVKWSKSMVAQMERAISKVEKNDKVLEAFSAGTVLRVMSTFLIEGQIDLIADPGSSKDSSYIQGGRFLKTEHGNFIHLSRTVTFSELRTASLLTSMICITFGYADYLDEILYSVFRWCKHDSRWLLNVSHSLFVLICNDSCQQEQNSLLRISLRSINDILEGHDGRLLECYANKALSNNRWQKNDLKCQNCPFRDGTLHINEVCTLLLESLEHCTVSFHDNDRIKPCHAPRILVKLGEKGCKDLGEGEVIAVNGWVSSLNDSIRSLELLALFLGWDWTYNELVPQLWKLAQPCASEFTLVALFLLLGLLGRFGRDSDGHEQYGVEVIRNNFSNFLEHHSQHKSGLQFPLSSQATVAQALLNLVADRKNSCSSVSSKFHITHKQTLKKWYLELNEECKSSLPEQLRADIYAIQC